MVMIMIPMLWGMMLYFVKLKGEDLSRYLNKTEKLNASARSMIWCCKMFTFLLYIMVVSPEQLA